MSRSTSAKPSFRISTYRTDSPPRSICGQLCEQGLTRRFGDAESRRSTGNASTTSSTSSGRPVSRRTSSSLQDFVNWAKEARHRRRSRSRFGRRFARRLPHRHHQTSIRSPTTLLFERFPQSGAYLHAGRRHGLRRRPPRRCARLRPTGKYGADHVAQIITFGTMAAKAAIRDTGRALGFPYSFCDQISKMIPMFTSLEKAVEEVPGAQETLRGE
jgi:hypothetical protein